MTPSLKHLEEFKDILKKYQISDRAKQALTDLKFIVRSEEHTSEHQSHSDLVCRLLLEKKKKKTYRASFVKPRSKNNYYCYTSEEWVGRKSGIDLVCCVLFVTKHTKK